VKIAYETLIKVEEDCKEAIDIARQLKKGILLNNISKEKQNEMVDKIIEVLEK